MHTVKFFAVTTLFAASVLSADFARAGGKQGSVRRDCSCEVTATNGTSCSVAGRGACNCTADFLGDAKCSVDEPQAGEVRANHRTAGRIAGMVRLLRSFGKPYATAVADQQERIARVLAANNNRLRLDEGGYTEYMVAVAAISAAEGQFTPAEMKQIAAYKKRSNRIR